VIDTVVSNRDDKNVSIEDTGKIISAMVEDVTREASREIVDNQNVRKAIGSKTARLFKEYLASQLHGKQAS
jgi:hypothetical protein